MGNISDISFIIIVLNEQFAIGRCLSSIEKMSLSNGEVICVDSSSTDNTIPIIKRFKGRLPNLRLFKIKGYANAAIARNIGIKYSTKKYISFVDGDIELNENFIIEALKKIEHSFSTVTGDLTEYQYTANYENIVRKIKSRVHIKKELPIYLSGGSFLMRREIIKDIGFFNEKFEVYEDWEFTLRLTRKYQMVALPLVMGTHHTIPYCNKRRIITSLKRCHSAYAGMIIRRNMLNYKGLNAYFWRDRGRVLGLFLIFAMFLMLLILPSPEKYAVIASLFVMDIAYGKLHSKDVFHRVVLHYISPIYLGIGIIFDIDHRKKYSVVEINIRNS